MGTKTDWEICEAAISHIKADSPVSDQLPIIEFKARFDVFKIEEMLDKIETEKLLAEASSGLLSILRDRYAAAEKLNADLNNQNEELRLENQELRMKIESLKDALYQTQMET